MEIQTKFCKFKMSPCCKILSFFLIFSVLLPLGLRDKQDCKKNWLSDVISTCINEEAWWNVIYIAFYLRTNFVNLSWAFLFQSLFLIQSKLRLNFNWLLRISHSLCRSIGTYNYLLLYYTVYYSSGKIHLYLSGW